MIRYVLFIIALLILQSRAIASEQFLKQPFKVGFVLIGPVNDLGWNYAHNQGRLFLESNMKGKVETELAENIPDSAESERIMEKMIARGDSLIFTTSYGLLEHAEKVAARHPEVTFVHLARPSQAKLKNLSTCLTYHWEPVYVAGVVAGRMTKTNKLGFVAAHSVPQVLQTINAFTLGARSVNPKATVQVVWTNTWCDPPLEAEAAKGLIESGVDILTMHENNPTTIIQTAEKNNIYSVGFHSDLSKFAAKGWLTGEMWNWGPLYVQIAKGVANHTWQSGNYKYDMKSGYVKIAPFGAIVPIKVQQEALSVRDKLNAASLSVFQGPIKDRDGKERVARGKMADFKTIESMDWLVEGVEGAFKKK